MFIISSLERTDPAQDDSTYSVNLENDGEPDTLDESAITEPPETEAPEAKPPSSPPRKNENDLKKLRTDWATK